MKGLTIILTLIFLTSTSQTFACDCESQGHFLTVAPKSKLVALVKVNSYLTFKNIYDKPTPMSMEVEIVKVYLGQETRKTVTVWGDNGKQCRPYLSFFKTDNYYVIAFDQDSKENPLDYAISNCGDYWLTADNEKKIANGAVNGKQNEIAFSDLVEFFHGDKTKELTPTDFKEIFQLAFDLPKLQQYFHIDTDTTRKQIVIQYFGDAKHNNLTGVEKFGRQIKIMTEEEIKKQQIKYYFVLGDWVCGLNSVRLQLSYVGEGLTASYMFKKVDGKWTILNSELWEK
ncbi:MAG: hypothetical protein QY319_10335 [Candidatus Kapaibacterium sp.]|nr:MAG: hypothetical protein QY319_10335 [Candidatus Kapabacteria bacterium]